jgi:hypothetical protein
MLTSIFLEITAFGSGFRRGVFLSGASFACQKVRFSSCLARYVYDVGPSVPGLCNDWIAFIFYYSEVSLCGDEASIQSGNVGWVWIWNI